MMSWSKGMWVPLGRPDTLSGISSLYWSPWPWNTSISWWWGWLQLWWWLLQLWWWFLQLWWWWWLYLMMGWCPHLGEPSGGTWEKVEGQSCPIDAVRSEQHLGILKQNKIMTIAIVSDQTDDDRWPLIILMELYCPRMGFPFPYHPSSSLYSYSSLLMMMMITPHDSVWWCRMP